jgi:hypothetical protein
MRMKKLISAASALTLAASAFAGLAVTANAAETKTTIYENDFETSSDFTNTKDGGILYNPATSAANTRGSQIIGRGSGSGDTDLTSPSFTALEAYGTGDDAAKIIDVSFAFKIDATTQGKASNIALLGGTSASAWLSSSKQILTISASSSSNGYFGSVTVNGADITSAVKETAGTYENNNLNRNTTGWVDLKARINFNTHKVTYSLEKNSVVVVESTEADFVNTDTEQLDRLFIAAGKTYGGAYIDDVKIEKVTTDTEYAYYTVVKKSGDTEIGRETFKAEVGTTPEIDKDALTIDGVKYEYESDDSDGVTVASGGTTVYTVQYKANQMYDVTVNKVCGEEVLSTETVQVANGDTYTPQYDTSFNSNGYKYTYVSGGDAVTVSSTQTINIEYSKRELATTTVTLNATYGDSEAVKIGETSVIEDSSYTLTYPKYVIKDGTLYSVVAEYFDSKNYFDKKGTGTTEDQTFTVNYTADSANNAVYFAEAEDLGSDSNIGNADIRCSSGKVYKVPTDGIDVTTLQPGKYTVEIAVWGTAGDTYTVKAGDATVATAATAGSLVTVVGDEFELTEATAITAVGTAAKNSGLDYILIRKTGDVEVEEPVVPTEITVTKVSTNNDESKTGAAKAFKAVGKVGTNDIKNVKWSIEVTGKDAPATADIAANIASGTEFTYGLVVSAESVDISAISDTAEVIYE